MDGGEGVALSGAERGRNLMKPERWKRSSIFSSQPSNAHPRSAPHFLMKLVTMTKACGLISISVIGSAEILFVFMLDVEVAYWFVGSIERSW